VRLERAGAMSTPIFLASGNRMKRMLWVGSGGGWADLALAHKKGKRTNPVGFGTWEHSDWDGGMAVKSKEKPTYRVVQ